MLLCGCSDLRFGCFAAEEAQPDHAGAGSPADCETKCPSDAVVCDEDTPSATMPTPVEEVVVEKLPAHLSLEQAFYPVGPPCELASDVNTQQAPPPPRGKPLTLQAQSQEEQIEKDIPRTFAGHPQVAGLEAIIRQILLDYAVADPDVGYCQGMSFVAAVVSANVPDPSEASSRFTDIVTTMRGLWLPGFPLLVAGVLAFDALLRRRCPELYEHFVRLQLMLDSFLPDVWLTLFAKWLTFAKLWPALQFLQGRGFVGVLSLTLELIGAHAFTLQAAEDFADLYSQLKSLHLVPDQPDLADILARAEASIPEARDMLAMPPEELAEDSIPARLISAASMSSNSMSLTRQGSEVVNSWSGFNLLEDSHNLQLLYGCLAYRVGEVGSAVHSAAHTAHLVAHDAVHGAAAILEPVGHGAKHVVHGAKHVVHGTKDVAAGAALAAVTCEKALASTLAANRGAYRAAAAAAHVSQELRDAVAMVSSPLHGLSPPSGLSSRSMLHRITEERSEDIASSESLYSLVASVSSGLRGWRRLKGFGGALCCARRCECRACSWCCRRAPVEKPPPGESSECLSDA